MKNNEIEILKEMFAAAVDAAMPASRVPAFLPKDLPSRLAVVGAGKASAAMAKALEENYDGELSGLVLTRYGHAVDCDRVEIVQASHPVPDEAGMNASQRILEIAQGLGEDDLLLVLVSGGGSALLTLPVDGVSLEDKQKVNSELLRCGASIDEINCLRKHLSQIKGGRLAVAAYPAKVVSLLISDVPGDDPSVIASGPTVPDDTSLADARAIVEKYQLNLPASVRAALADEVNETPSTGASELCNASFEMIATPQASLEAAAEVARSHGITPLILGDAIEGEAQEVGKVMAGIAAQVVTHQQPIPAPCVLISGGETTVTVKGNGRGGRNVEFLLGLADALDGLNNVYALAADTDGIDGREEVAGAAVTPSTLSRAVALGFPVGKALANNDGHSFFETLGDQVITGPTLTNVNDFRAILVTSDQSD